MVSLLTFRYTDSSMFDYCAMEYDMQCQYVCDEDGAVGAILQRSSPHHKLTMGEHLWKSRIRAPVRHQNDKKERPPK